MLEELTGHGEGSVNSVAWNPRNEKMFASCSDDHTIRIWESPVTVEIGATGAGAGRMNGFGGAGKRNGVEGAGGNGGMTNGKGKGKGVVRQRPWEADMGVGTSTSATASASASGVGEEPMVGDAPSEEEAESTTR
jgi:hypothetical protein